MLPAPDWLGPLLSALIGGLVAATVTHFLADRRQRYLLNASGAAARLLQDRSEIRSAMVSIIISSDEIARLADVAWANRVPFDNLQIGLGRTRDKALIDASRVHARLTDCAATLEVFVGAEHALAQSAIKVIRLAYVVIEQARLDREQGAEVAALGAETSHLRSLGRQHLQLASLPALDAKS